MLFANTVTLAQGSAFFAGGNICPVDTWKLVFQDEFNGSSLDFTKWKRYYPCGPGGNDQCEFSRTHGSEQQVYKDNNVTVTNGKVILTAKKEYSTWYTSSRNYSSGMIHSTEPNDFMYGKFEIRCKIPSGSLWPAFWLFGEDGSEIDIFEFLNLGPSNNQFGIRKWQAGSVIGQDYHSYYGTDFSLDFHIYTLERDPWFLTFKIDNIEVWRANKFFQLNGAAVTWCNVAAGTYAIHSGWPTGPTHVIANLAVGQSPPPSQNIYPQNMEVDYIRVYQRTPQSGFFDLCTQNLINGNDKICSQGQYTYEYTGPNVGYINSWSSSSNIVIISSSANSLTIKALNNSINGSAWIKANFTSSSPCTQSDVTKSIWIGKPENPVLLIHNKPCDDCITFRILNNSSTGANFTWDIDGHLFTGNYVSYCDQISIPYGYVNYTVNATNLCGVATTSGTAEYEVCDKLLNIFPNPVSESLNLNFKNISAFENVESVEIINPDGLILNSFDQLNIPSNIDVTTYRTGIYTISVEMKNGKKFLKSVSIIHK